MGGSPDNPRLSPLQADETARPAEDAMRLGKYELIKLLSVGGMAEIFLARVVGLPGFQKLVVVKRILPHLARKRDFCERFLDEARIAATLQHPNIVQTYDVGVVDGNHFISMEYLHGEDVRAILRAAHRQSRRIPREQVLQIVMGLCAGLHYAHEKEGFDGKPLDIVHCDVSPGNLVVTYEGGIKLVDFGIACAANRSHETRSGTIKGKLGYISPEQARADKIDRRTDVFAAGVILYELSLGKKLYKGTTDYEILQQVVEGKIVPPRKIDPTYDVELERIVLRALERDPERRYQTAHDMQMALEALARDRGLFLSSTGLKQLMADLFGHKLAASQGKSLVEVVASYEDEAEESASDDEWSSEPAKRVPRRRLLAPLAVAAGVVALVGGGVALRSRHAVAPAVPSAIATVPAAPAPAAPPATAPTANAAATTPQPGAVVASPSATPRPATAAATGTIKVVTHPHGAAISVDGRPADQRSPAVFEALEADREHSVVALLDGYKEAKKRISVGPDKRTTVTLSLTRASAAAASPSSLPVAEAKPQSGEGTLAIASNPWCAVAVDGVERGQTPINIKVAAGRHTLTLSNPDYRIKRQLSVTIKPNETVRKKLDFSE